MNPNTLQNFVDNYTQTDFDKIKFDWNGKYADEFEDKNMQFRNRLLEYIIPQINNTNIELIKTLYVELSKFAKESWGVSRYFNLLAQELIIRDYKKYLIDYLEGASQSMDTYLASGQIIIPPELALEIVSHMTSESKMENDERKKALLSSVLFLERFKFLSQK